MNTSIKQKEKFWKPFLQACESQWRGGGKRYALKEDTAEHYRLQQNVYNFLLRKNKYQTEDYFLLLFYVPKEVTATGEVIFDTELVKMKVNISMAEKAWKKALKLLNSDCPNKSCEWCERV